MTQADVFTLDPEERAHLRHDVGEGTDVVAFAIPRDATPAFLAAIKSVRGSVDSEQAFALWLQKIAELPRPGNHVRTGARRAVVA